MRPSKAFFLGLAGMAVLLGASAGYKVLTKYPVPGGGGFDYIYLDEAARHLYVSHGTQVDVVEADTGKFVGTIPDTPGVHGAAVAAEFGHGFTSNGREDKVSMFDPATLKLIRKIDVGKGPDGIYYHPKTKRVFTNNHGSHDITAIDAATGNVAGTVDVKGDGEQAIFAKDGLVYVNSEETAEVIAFDPASLTVKKRYPIGVAKTPTGLAYDAKTNLLFIGCREEPMMVVMDASNGKVVAHLPIGKGVDYAGIDAQARLVFFSCGEGVLNIFHIDSASKFTDEGALTTQPSAKTMIFDPKTRKIFLPAAEFEESPATEPGKRPRRSVKPGTFVIVVVGK